MHAGYRRALVAVIATFFVADMAPATAAAYKVGVDCPQWLLGYEFLFPCGETYPNGACYDREWTEPELNASEETQVQENTNFTVFDCLTEAIIAPCDHPTCFVTQ